jgi:glycerol-1-phosphate dehydrogenase [NAD(P)+]
MHEKPIVSERIVASGALAALPRILADYHLGTHLLIVHDGATRAAAGNQFFANLPQTLKSFFYSLDTPSHPSMRHVAEVMASATSAQATCIVAMGSGTINDICKLSAARLGLPYVVVATAASMNGYSSANASVMEDGKKRSFAANPPRVVIADLDILAAAPRRLARAGLGDTLCRTTVEADCLLSHHLFGTPYPADVFNYLRAHEAGLMAGASALRGNSSEYMGLLMQALLDAGDAMTVTGSSAVASQGEHMIAHTIEMLYGDECQAMHGEIIAVTTTSMRHLQQKMVLAQPKLREMAVNCAQFKRVFGNVRGDELMEIYQKKQLTASEVNDMNQRLSTQWPEIKRALGEVMIQGSAIDLAFMQASIGTHCQAIKLEEARYQSALSYAHLTRDRFTFLDLAAMMGRRA